jgi:epoxyqueuosine reductase
MNNIDTLEDNQVKLDTGAPTDSATRPYTIDKRRLRRYRASQTVFGRHLNDPKAPFFRRSMERQAVIRASEEEPGYTHVEHAMARASWTVQDHLNGAYGIERLGGENAALCALGRHRVEDPGLMTAQVKQAARLYGAVLTGVAPIDRRWIYRGDRQGRPVEVPGGLTWAVVMAVPMDLRALMQTPDQVAGAATGAGYSRMAVAAASMAQFIRGLGYCALSMGNDTALSIPLAVDAGLGRLGRHGMLVTPEYGAAIRLCKVFTDLPLVPDRPIEFGLEAVCRTCRRCADACEAGAISDAAEPSYALACPSTNPGVKRWAVDSDRCYQYWMENGASCSTCITACPYTRRALNT